MLQTELLFTKIKKKRYVCELPNWRKYETNKAEDFIEKNEQGWLKKVYTIYEQFKKRKNKQATQIFKKV